MQVTVCPFKVCHDNNERLTLILAETRSCTCFYLFKNIQEINIKNSYKSASASYRLKTILEHLSGGVYPDKGRTMAYK